MTDSWTVILFMFELSISLFDDLSEDILLVSDSAEWLDPDF